MDFKRLNRLIFKVFTLGIFLAAFILAGIDARGFTSALINFKIGYIPVILLFVILNYILRFIKWNYYLKQIDINIPIKDSILIFASALPMTITPGKVGEFIKSYMLKVKYNYSAALTSPMVIVERLTDSIGMVLLTAIGVLSFNFGVSFLIIAILLIILGMIILQSKKLCYGTIGIISRFPIVKKYAPPLTHFYESICSILKIRILTAATLIGTTAWIFEGLVVYFSAKGAGVNISILYAIFILALSSIAGAVSMIPGGIVISEGSMLAMLVRVGAQKGAAGFISFIIRIATLWIGVIVGSFVLLKMEKKLFDEVEN